MPDRPQIQLGDYDSSTQRPAVYGGVESTETSSTHVCDLQEILNRLGFLVVTGDTPGDFQRHTEWAVREFQRQAKQGRIAKVRDGVTAADLETKRYAELLEEVNNPGPYAGPVSGVVDADTWEALEAWDTGSETEGYRCPVIIEAWKYDKKEGVTQDVPDPGNRNIWRASEGGPGNERRVFAYDLSDAYAFPEERKHFLTGTEEDAGSVVLGYRTGAGYGGPDTDYPHTWHRGAASRDDDTEVLPSPRFPGSGTEAAPSAVFRVVRALAEAECKGYFDIVNGWDSGILSTGPCHWTLFGEANAPAGKGELNALLAYLRSTNEAEYREAFDRFGIRPSQVWKVHGTEGAGEDLANDSQRKYECYLHLQNTEETYPRPLKEKDELARKEANQFRDWNWFYRLQTATRLYPSFPEAMWTFTLVRIRDLLGTPWSVRTSEFPNLPRGTFGDTFTSERCIALVLRWHVNRPGHIVSGGRSGEQINKAYEMALATARAREGDGDDVVPDQLDLAVAIERRFWQLQPADEKKQNRSMKEMFCWPHWAGGPGRTNFKLPATPGEEFLPAAKADNPAQEDDFRKRLNAGDLPSGLVETFKKFSPPLELEGTWHVVGVTATGPWQIAGRRDGEIEWYFLRYDKRKEGGKDVFYFRLYQAGDWTLNLRPQFTWDSSGLPPHPFPAAGKRYGGFRLRKGDKDEHPVERFALDVALTDELVDGAPSAEVGEAFRDAGFELSDGATVQMVQAGQRWRLRDPGAQKPDFEVRRGGEELKVYELVFVYGGKVWTAGDGVPLPDSHENGYVRQLQQDLSGLDCMGTTAPNGIFGPRTQEAVKSFQTMARGPFAAIDPGGGAAYPLRLTPVEIPAALRFSGDVSGQVGAETRHLIGVWIDNSFRSSVVFFARALPSLDVIPGFDRLYSATDYPLAGGEVWSRDLSGYYEGLSHDPLPLGRCNVPVPGESLPVTLDVPTSALNNPMPTAEIKEAFADAGRDLSDEARVFIDIPDRRWVILDPAEGKPDYMVRLEGTGGSAELRVYSLLPPRLEAVNLDVTLDGQLRSYRHCSPEAEFTPSNLDPPATDPADDATIRVLRGVLEETNDGGFLDGVRSAVGRLLRAAGLDTSIEGDPLRGGLGAFLDRFREYFPAEFERQLERSGILPVKGWRNEDRRPNGGDSFDPSTRSYRDGIGSARDEEAEDGQGPGMLDDTPTDEQLALRHWPAFYRFKMALRLDGRARRAVYDQLRTVARELLDAPWDASSGQRFSVGAVFASERTGALLILWHLERPSDLFANGEASPLLRGVVTDAGLDPSQHATWDVGEEERLVAALEDSAPEEVRNAIQRLLRWPDWDPESSTDPRRGSFDRELVTTVSIPDIGGALADALDAGEVPDSIRDALEEQGLILSAAGDVTVDAVTEGSHWIVSDEVPGKGYRLRIRQQQDESLIVYGGLLPKREGGGAWLNRAGLSPRPDAERQSTRYLVLLGPTAPSGGELNRVRLALVYEPEEAGDDRLVGAALSRSGNPTEGIEFAVTSASNVPRFALQEPGATSWNVRNSLSAGTVPVPVRPLDPDGEIPGDEFDIHLSLAGWQGAESLLPLDARLRLADLSADGGSVVGTIRLAFEATAGFLGQPVECVLNCDGDDDPGDISEFRWEEGPAVIFPSFPIGRLLGAALPLGGLNSSLPLTIRPDGPHVRLDSAGPVPAGLSVPLGSPAVTLALKSPVELALSSVEGLSLLPAAAERVRFALGINPFTASDLFPADIIQAWSSVPDVTNPEMFDELLSIPSPADGVALPDATQFLRWRGEVPELQPALFTSLSPALVNPALRLQTLSGPTLGEASAALVRLAEGGTRPDFAFDEASLRWHLSVPVALTMGRETDTAATLFTLQGVFQFSVDADLADPRGSVPLAAGSFKVDPRIDFVVSEEQRCGFADDMVSLHLPKGTVLTLIADPMETRLFLNKERTLENTNRPIAVRVPGDIGTEDPASAPRNRFTWEMREFSIGQEGFSFLGAARVESVRFGNAPQTDPSEEPLAGFAEPLQIHAASSSEGATETDERVAGELQCLNSRFVYGSVRATSMLGNVDATDRRNTYFDDAVVTLQFTLSQPAPGSLQIVGTLEIDKLIQFRVDSLFATFSIRHLELKTTYKRVRAGGSWREGWESRGAMSGDIVFRPPPGGSAAEVGPGEKLFQGLAVTFEHLDPVRVGVAELGISLRSPLEFSFGEIFTITLNSLRIAPARGARKKLAISGGMRLENVAGTDTKVDFEELTIEERGTAAPLVTVDAITVQMTLGGGSLKLSARLGRIANEQEFGYEGKVSIRSEALGDMSGLLQLTRVKTPYGFVASKVVYFETKLEVMLFTDVFLRSVGLGVAVNRTLRGLPTGQSGQSIDELIRFVTDPAGLPNPSDPKSWRPDPPAEGKPPRWLLVGTGIITLGHEPPEKEHLVTGSFLLTVGPDGVLVGANLWVLTSPEQAQTPEYFARPLARGGVMLSTRERSLSGAFLTLKNPRLSDKAPPVLKDVLSQVQTSLVFRADQNGFVMQMGWPWETRIGYSVGPFRGELNAGFRFGMYRGAIAFGINQGIDLRLDLTASAGFDTKYGSLGAKLSLTGQAYARASINGGLTPSLTPLLLGDMAAGGSVTIRAQAHGRLGPKWSPLRIDFDVSAGISISASLTVALSSGGFGLDGYVEGSISVRGRRLSGSFHMRYQEGLIGSTRDQLASLLPQLPALPVAFRSDALPAAEPGPEWIYDVRRVPRGQDGERTELRILIFPNPLLNYPRLAQEIVEDPSIVLDDEENPRFRVVLKTGWMDENDVTFQGFLGAENVGYRLGEAVDDTRELCWNEALDKVIDGLRAEDLRNDPSRVNADPRFGTELGDVTIARVLGALEEDYAAGPVFLSADDEIITDPRPWLASPGDADDPTAGLTRTPSPYLKRTTEYDRELAEACLPRELSLHRVPAVSDPEDVGGVSSSLLYVDLISLQRDPEARPNRASRRNRIARHLHCILVFEGPKDVLAASDIVSQLIDAEDAQLAGEPSTLEPGRTPPPEFALILRPSGQSENAITLVWDFHPEVDEEISLGEVYEHLEFFRISRNVMQKDTASQVVGEVVPFFVNPAGTRKYIKPQHDFTDRDLRGVSEGDILEYRIEAIGREDDEVLAHATVRVPRQTVKAVLAPSQCVAFHEIRQDERDGSRADAGTVTFVVAFPASEEQSHEPLPRPGDLKLFFVPKDIQAVGLYGAQPEPDGGMRWEDGLPETLRLGREVAEVRFGTSGADRSLPWEEAEPIDHGESWERITIVRADSEDQSGEDSALEGYRLRIAERSLRRLLGLSKPDRAIQFYVGVEIAAAPGQPLRRSHLVRCRHAVLLGAQVERDADVPLRELTRGNTVPAFEWIPDSPDGLQQYLEPDDADPIGVAYSENIGAAQGLRPLTYLPGAMLLLSWPHRMTLTGDPLTRFDPIVGYRVHRADALAPFSGEHESSEVIAQRELLVQTVPWKQYRSSPVTVWPVLVDTDQGKVDWVPPTDGPSVTGWVSDPTRQLPTSTIPQTDGPPATGLRLAYQPNAVDSGPVWLLAAILGSPLDHQTGLGAIGVICQQLATEFREPLGITAEILPGDPLDDRGADLLPTATLRTRLAEMLGQDGGRFAPDQDPYGWRALEALGLCCECRLRLSSGEPVPPEIFLGTLPGHEGFPARLRTALEEEVPNCPVSIHLYLADDRETPLYTVRFIFAGQEEKRWGDGRAIIAQPSDVRALQSGRITPELLARIPHASEEFPLVPDGGSSRSINSDEIEVSPIARASEGPDLGWLVLPRRDLLLFGRGGHTRGGLFFIPDRSAPQPADGSLRLRVFRTWRVWSEETIDSVTRVYFSECLGMRLFGRRHLKPPRSMTPDFTPADEALTPPFSADNETRRLREMVVRLVIDLQRRAFLATADLELRPGRVTTLLNWPTHIEEARLASGFLPSELSVPIRPGSIVTCRLPVRDRWAHEYLVAWSLVRRYDHVWSLLRPEAGPGARTELSAVPRSSLTHASVLRTEPLVDPALVVTPLPGSVQAILFKHPAAFAADATAAGASRGQHSGQTVILLRRLSVAAERRIQTILEQGFPVKQADDDVEGVWQRYQDRWLPNAASGEGHPVEPPPTGRIGPKLIRHEAEEELALVPVRGTTDGLPFADRYVFSDLPGYYYEYRVAAFITAGLVKSIISLSANVKVLYDGPRRRDLENPPEPPRGGYRQRPQCFTVREATYQRREGQEPLIDLAIGLVPPRHHMPQAVAPLWIDSDRTQQLPLPSGDRIPVRLGSLPDLQLTYFVFFRVPPRNRPDVNPASRPLLRPSCVILPPGISNDDTETRFRADVVDQGLTFIPLDEDNGDADGLPPVAIRQSEDGELLLRLRFQVRRSSPLITQFEAMGAGDVVDIGSACYLASQRDGIVSELRPGQPR